MVNFRMIERSFLNGPCNVRVLGVKKNLCETSGIDEQETLMVCVTDTLRIYIAS